VSSSFVALLGGVVLLLGAFVLVPFSADVRLLGALSENYGREVGTVSK
jgi:hypothetical protein